jgi:hypothetical protein
MRDSRAYGKPESNLEMKCEKQGRRSLAADEPDAAKPEPRFQPANHANVFFVIPSEVEGSLELILVFP